MAWSASQSAAGTSARVRARGELVGIAVPSRDHSDPIIAFIDRGLGHTKAPIRAIERLRVALGRACGVPADAINWSYDGVSGEKSTVRVSVRLDVPQTDNLAEVVARNCRAPS